MVVLLCRAALLLEVDESLFPKFSQVFTFLSALYTWRSTAAAAVPGEGGVNVQPSARPLSLF